MRCAEAIVASLVAHGVTDVFGIPGTHNLPVYDHLPASPIRHITPRHEQGAGYAADAYARATGGPGVCLTTTGPGVTNIMTAVATAHHDSVPLLLLSPGMPTGIDGGDTGFLHEVKAQSQAVDAIARSVRARTARDAVQAVADAFESFASSRPRPWHVEIPLDILNCSEELDPVPAVAAPRRPQPDDAALEAAAAALVGAQAPCMLLGGGAVDAGGQAVALAERLGAMVITTVRGKGTVPESHPLSLGASLRLAAARRAACAADVVLAVGTELSESELWVRELPLSGTLIRVDIDSDQLQKNAPATIVVHADAEPALEGLLRLLSSSVAARPRGAELAAARAQIQAEADLDGAPFKPLHDALRRVLDRDAIVVGDSAQAVYYGTVHQLPAELPRRLLYPVGFATLGYTMPGAIGAKLACPETQVVGITGDGGLMFTLPELATAVELALPLPIIVVNNGGYGEIRDEMVRRGAEPLGVDLVAPDFVRVAEAFGARGMRLDNADQLAPVVEQALGAAGPTVVEILQP